MQGKHQKQSKPQASFIDKARQMTQKITSSLPGASRSESQEESYRGSARTQADQFGGRRRQRRAPRKQNVIKRVVNRWCNRLLGVVTEGSFDQEEEFASHRTSRDYICNTIGTGAWGMVFPFLTIVVTQLSAPSKRACFLWLSSSAPY